MNSYSGANFHIVRYQNEIKIFSLIHCWENPWEYKQLAKWTTEFSSRQYSEFSQLHFIIVGTWNVYRVLAIDCYAK